MSKSKDGTKITLGMIKGKAINTSVPSIAIRFNANAEEIEELYQSEDEPAEKLNNEKTKPSGISDPDTSPLRYLPRLGKRCTSVDASLVQQDSSPPSDRWKFFTEIKGKITKSVEEIKHRNQEVDNTTKKPKNTKDKDSSLSESDELSESSLSRTYGVSTTEGVEMSTDDETPSIEPDKKPKEIIRNEKKHLRYRLVRRKRIQKEENSGTVSVAELYEIATGSKPDIPMKDSQTSQECIEVESGVEALEGVNLQVQEDTIPNVINTNELKETKESVSEILRDVVGHIENIEADEENKLKVIPVSGSTVKQCYISKESNRIYYQPEGFVDLREVQSSASFSHKIYSFRYVLAGTVVFLCHLLSILPLYMYGFISGILFTMVYSKLYTAYFEFTAEKINLHETFVTADAKEQHIFEIPAVKEYHPITKVEGWMNEYPEVYNPQTYHIAQTQPVCLRLQGHLLRISHTRTKIPKRALWNEPKQKHIVFCGHRIYNLLGANVRLLPIGLNKRRHWSKKYPICITLNKENLNFISEDGSDTEDVQKTKIKDKDDTDIQDKKQKPLKKEMQAQIFSKLTEEEENFLGGLDLLTESTEAPTKPAESCDEFPIEDEDEDIYKEVYVADDEQDDESFSVDWTSFISEKCGPTETRIYLFGRTDREKEDWYRRLVSATHKVTGYNDGQSLLQKNVSNKSSKSWDEQEYLQYVNKYQKLYDDSKQDNDFKSCANTAWINAIISRVLFDCTRDPTFTYKVEQRIQRKLSTFKLPYFIEQLSIRELSLGSNPPLIHNISNPTLDQRGLWVDLDVRYNGNIVLKLQTKLNLMKLKHLPNTDSSTVDSSSAKWQHSDVDDTAESSSDCESFIFPTSGKVAESNVNSSSTGTTNSSKKIFKMVDKIAESKFFQAATENRYIKKAMEGVSNTELCLKVELKGLVGTLVINMPPPPSDRIWIGFRPLPQLCLSAQPIVGERNFSFIKQLTKWIEKKLTQEFQKVLVIPNMEDIVIPVMSSKLPT